MCSLFEYQISVAAPWILKIAKKLISCSSYVFLTWYGRTVSLKKNSCEFVFQKWHILYVAQTVTHVKKEPSIYLHSFSFFANTMWLKKVVWLVYIIGKVGKHFLSQLWGLRRYIYIIWFSNNFSVTHSNPSRFNLISHNVLLFFG